MEALRYPTKVVQLVTSRRTRWLFLFKTTGVCLSVFVVLHWAAKLSVSPTQSKVQAPPSQKLSHAQEVQAPPSQQLSDAQEVQAPPSQQLSHAQEVQAPPPQQLSDAQVAARFQERRQRLQSACRLYSNSSLFRNRAFRALKIPRHPPLMNVSTAYCPIEKTGSTTWRGVLGSIRDLLKERRVPAAGSPLADGSEDVLFTFVREPYSRILSAYVDKIFSPNNMFWALTGRYVVQNFRHNASRRSLECGHDVTFPEFVKFFIHMLATGDKANGHYLPVYDQCEMCSYPYRYIGHLETMREDMPFILRAMQSPVRYEKTFDNATINNNAVLALKGMREKIQKCISLDEAARRVWKKWHVRGIIHKAQTFPFPRETTGEISAAQLTEAGVAALAASGAKSLRSGQKQAALREAFAGVPIRDRLELARGLFLDFQMFGFDPWPQDVFPKTPYIPDPDFSYFDLYQ